MGNKDLKKLSRSELIEILLEQAGEIDELKAKLEDAENELANAQEELKSRKIKIDNVGSIAEASVLVSGVLEAAQKAADIYLENVRDTDSICAKMREDAEAQAKKTIEEAEKAAELKETAARISADKYWDEVSQRLEKFYDEHSGLRDLLNIGTDPANI